MDNINYKELNYSIFNEDDQIKIEYYENPNQKQIITTEDTNLIKVLKTGITTGYINKHPVDAQIKHIDFPNNHKQIDITDHELEIDHETNTITEKTQIEIPNNQNKIKITTYQVKTDFITNTIEEITKTHIVEKRINEIRTNIIEILRYIFKETEKIVKKRIESKLEGE